MNTMYEEIKDKAFSAFRALSKECAPFEEARMLLGAADATTSLTKSKIIKTIDVEWIEKIEAALPALDVVVRNPSVAIEDVDEILPVELSKHITDKSIKHLAQHTNLILSVEGDEITPQKILNVFHEETSLTYENKFVNTLLSRLSAFVDKRLRVLNGTNGTEMNYKFGYSTEFEHFIYDGEGRNSARIELRIELTSPAGVEPNETDLALNERYKDALNRIKRINMALIGYGSSAFAQKLGKNYVRPPIVRTNAILKNKNLKELLNLWEYIENYDKVGYSFIGDKDYQLPADDFVGSMYSGIALQYLTLYSGIATEDENARLMAQKHLFETMPEFNADIENEELDDYQVYDAEYKKTVPVSRLMNSRKKLSEDEKRMRQEILISLKADEILYERELERKRAEEEARRLAEEEAKRHAEEEERRLAEEEAKRLAEEAERRAAEEAAVVVNTEVDEISEESLEKLVESVIEGKASLEISESGTRIVVRRGARDAEKQGFVFSGEEGGENAVVVPYTRAQYLALPRKKKKSVLMRVKALVRYQTTARLVSDLRSLNTDSERVAQRIATLEAKLGEEKKGLSSSGLWADAVKKIIQ